MRLKKQIPFDRSIDPVHSLFGQLCRNSFIMRFLSVRSWKFIVNKRMHVDEILPVV